MPRWQLLPEEPFSNVSRSPHWIIHPMRGTTENVRLASGFSRHPVEVLQAMSVGSALCTPHGKIKRIA